MTNKTETMALMNASLDSNLNIGGSGVSTNAVYVGPPLTGWGFFQDYYYPNVIRESYPVYIRERAEDKGKQAFEIIKAMQDKKVLKLDKVSDFIEVMDTLIKIL